MRVFKDDILEKEFRDQGYVLVNLLEDKEVRELQEFYSASPQEYQEKYTTFASNDELYKRRVNDFLKKVIGEKAENFLSPNMKPFWGNYMYKAPSENTNMPLHVDWQYVEEPEFLSLNLWAPLVDTNSKNGALHVVPKSHHVVDFPRGIDLPRYYEHNEQEIKDKYGKIILLKKGEAIIYDHRLLHYSLPNLSGESRLAVTLIYCPKEAETSIFYADNEGASKYRIEDEEVLLQTEYFKEFKGFKSKQRVVLPSFESVNLLSKLDAYHRDNKPSFLQRIKRSLLKS